MSKQLGLRVDDRTAEIIYRTAKENHRSAGMQLDVIVKAWAEIVDPDTAAEMRKAFARVRAQEEENK